MSKKQTYIGRFRVEPDTREDLERLHDFLVEEGIPMKPLEDTDKSLYGITGRFQKKNFSDALWQMNWMLKRKIIKKSGVPVRDITIEVRAVAPANEEHPESWGHWKTLDTFDHRDRDDAPADVVYKYPAR